MLDWWVKKVLIKKDRIVARMRKWQTRYLKKSHKFGIKIPRFVKQSLHLNSKTDNNFWADGINEEWDNVKEKFEILLDGEVSTHRSPICAMQYNIWYENGFFRHKARLEAEGYMTEALATITYASAMSRETVKILLIIAALNDFEVKLGNILMPMTRHLLQRRCRLLWVQGLLRMPKRL